MTVQIQRLRCARAFEERQYPTASSGRICTLAIGAYAVCGPGARAPVKVHAVDPCADTGAILAGAQYADAFCITVDDRALDARRAAERMLARGPQWIERLLALRNGLVAPFGLKTPAPRGTSSVDVIGIFPVVSETPARLVAGFNDKHLDFRVVVDVAPSDHGQCVTATTLVKTHNLLGRVYLAVILPFHRLVARNMLRQVAGSTEGTA
jgi:hypothetical protein